MTGNMGVRINSSASAAAKAAKSGQQVAAAKKDGQPAGAETDFSHVLAQARPKKAADAPTSDKPTPAAKSDGKKPVKAKGKSDRADDTDAAAASPDAVAKRPATDTSDDDAAPVDNGDADPVAETDGDSGDKDKSDARVDAGQSAAHIDPSQVTVAVTPPTQQQQTPAAAVTDASAESPAAKPVKAAPVAAMPVKPDPEAQATQQQQPVPAAGKGSDSAESKTGPDASNGHDAEAPKPEPTAAETGVAIQPVNRPGEQPAGGETGGTGIQAKQAKANPSQVATAASPAAKFNELFQAAADQIASGKDDKAVDKAASPTDVALAAVANDTSSTKTAEAKPAQVPQPPVAPDVRFAEDNHPKVVTAVKAHLLPGGGSIQLRLDPPDLGPLRLEVRMEDGAMSASFITASDQATSLLTHTLGQLKHALEGAGISVDKLQVRQGSAEHFSENSDQQRQQGGTGDQSSARQEQQRREMLNRMWQKVAGGDPLDLVA